jgi:hypothetical protein
MAGTTPRGYPYPQDSDLINVAVDIEKLARAVDGDVQSFIGTLNDADVWLQQQLDSHFTWIGELRRDLTANEVRDAAEPRVIAAEVPTLLDANGAGYVWFGANTFRPNTPVIVQISHMGNTGGDPGYWIEGRVYNQSYTGFSSQWVQQLGQILLANFTIPIAYTAVGLKP